MYAHRFPGRPVPAKSEEGEGTNLYLNILVQSQIVNLSLNCSCSLTGMPHDRTYISWYRWKEEIAL